MKKAGGRQHFGCSQSGCALRNRKRLFTLRIWHRCINYDQIWSRGWRCRILEFWGLGIRTCITSLHAFPSTLLSLYGTQFYTHTQKRNSAYCEGILRIWDLHRDRMSKSQRMPFVRLWNIN